MRLWMRAAAWLCLSLMLWTAAAESTHVHPSRAEGTSCSICMVAHTAAPSATVASGAPLFVAVGVSSPADATPKSDFALLDRGIRGPPAVL